MIDKKNITKQHIIKYLKEFYKVDVNDTRTLLEIVIEKFKNKQIEKFNGIWIF
ncbi:MAG: hypothetical protein IJP71_00795 [Lachnospiraceae bacterium]|nr:hypothetical protein [Lachnospiraceae bacterium]